LFFLLLFFKRERVGELSEEIIECKKKEHNKCWEMFEATDEENKEKKYMRIEKLKINF
jgi:hypothetical protein